MVSVGVVDSVDSVLSVDVIDCVDTDDGVSTVVGGGGEVIMLSVLGGSWVPSVDQVEGSILLTVE